MSENFEIYFVTTTLKPTEHSIFFLFFHFVQVVETPTDDRRKSATACFFQSCQSIPFHFHKIAMNYKANKYTVFGTYVDIQT